MSSLTALPDESLLATIAERCRAAIHTYADGCRKGAAPRPDAFAEELAATVRSLARETFADLKRRLTPEATVDPADGISPSRSPTITADGTGVFTPDGQFRDPEPPSARGRVPTLPGYAIEDTLGRGGMGVVYRATQLGLNRTVALKMILSGDRAGEQQIERFRTECRAIAQLKHPNVVQVYEVGEYDGLPYFSLEYCPGGTLERLANKEPIAPERAAGLIEPLARAAAAFHALGIVHRDLKPANVLLDAEGNPKITDFGLAQNVADMGNLTHTGAVLGTPTFMSPEQARGEPATPASDQYSLAATLYDLLTGRPPFHGTSVIDTLEQVRTREPIAPTHLQPGCPRDLETICLMAMSKDPAKRYASCSAFADDLRAYLDGRPITARPVSRVEKVWRWAKRNPRVAIPTGLAVAALLAVAVLGTTFAVVFDRQKREAQQLAIDRQAAFVQAEQLATERQKAVERAEQLAQQRQAALEQSEKDRIVADESYRLAREAVVGVADRLPDMLRKSLFARQAQQQVMAALGEALGKQADLAAARSLPARMMMNYHMKSAELATAVGDWAKADAAYAAAQELSARLMREDVAAKDRAKGNHALVLQRRATHALNRQGKPVDVPAVLALYREALDFQRQIVLAPTTGEIPAIEAKASVAATLYQIADVHRRTQKFADGIAAGEEALALRREVLAAPKTAYTVGAEQTLTDSLVQLGKLYTGLGDDAKAEPHLKEAADRLAKLTAADPTDQGLQLQAARVSRDYGDFLIMRDRLADAAPRYAADLALVKKILGIPELLQLQSELSDVYYRTATLALKRGDHKAADTDYRRCREIRQMLAEAVPANNKFQARLANAMARCGDHTSAAAILEKLLAVRPSGDLYNVACNFALCADAVRSGRPVSALSDDEKKLYDGYRVRAVLLLEKLVAAGYKDRVALATDPDLDALRDEPRYIALLARLKTPEPKRPK